MILPDAVTIGPHRYVIEPGGDGLCVPRRNVIALDGGQPPSQLADTLLHEVVHALLATVKLDDDVEEAVALALGPGLLALIADNPELIRSIAEAAR